MKYITWLTGGDLVNDDDTPITGRWEHIITADSEEDARFIMRSLVEHWNRDRPSIKNTIVSGPTRFDGELPKKKMTMKEWRKKDRKRLVSK